MMNRISFGLARMLSVLGGVLTGYLALVGIIGLVLAPFEVTAGPLTMRVGRYGATTETVPGFLVCSVVTIGLCVASWALLVWIPVKLTPPDRDDAAQPVASADGPPPLSFNVMNNNGAKSGILQIEDADVPQMCFDRHQD